MTYVISDIHGNYDKFLEMLEEINFQSTDIMYVLGDVIDRGNKSIKCLLYIMSQPNIHMLLSNHEEFMLDYFKRNKLPKNMSEVYEQSNWEIWFHNGGIETMRELIRKYKSKLQQILEYLKELPLTYVITVCNNKFYLVHADLEVKNYKVLSEQDRDYMLWNPKKASEQCILEDGNYIVTGHMHQIDSKILKYENWICVASETNYGNRKLSCLRLDDMKEFYV